MEKVAIDFGGSTSVVELGMMFVIGDSTVEGIGIAVSVGVGGEASGKNMPGEQADRIRVQSRIERIVLVILSKRNPR